MAIQKHLRKEAEKKRGKEIIEKLQVKSVVPKGDWQDKCPLCQKPVTLIWTSPDGFVKAFKCVKGHGKDHRVHPVFLVRMDLK